MCLKILDELPNDGIRSDGIQVTKIILRQWETVFHPPHQEDHTEKSRHLGD